MVRRSDELFGRTTMAVPIEATIVVRFLAMLPTGHLEYILSLELVWSINCNGR